MAAQYAYVMKGMTKTFPGAPKPVLNDISLQFYQGAKIGIVGPNGVGKSTLMKIMAGIDTDFTGFEKYIGKELPQEVVAAYFEAQDSVLLGAMTPADAAKQIQEAVVAWKKRNS